MKDNSFLKLSTHIFNKSKDKDDITTNRSSRWRRSVKNGVLRNFVKFTGKHLCQRPFCQRLCILRAAMNKWTTEPVFSFVAYYVQPAVKKTAILVFFSAYHWRPSDDYPNYANTTCGPLTIWNQLSLCIHYSWLVTIVNCWRNYLSANSCSVIFYYCLYILEYKRRWADDISKIYTCC